MAEVILSGLTKRFAGAKLEAAPAVNAIDLTVADREFMVLVGPSGCGKSTTLRMIAGLEDISAGDIYIDGRSVRGVAPKDRDIAMVFQNYALYPHLSVFENLAFGLRLRKVPRTEIASRVQEVAKLLGLTEYLERKPQALSGGQRQRVAVGRAIVRQPKVFLFDEPLSNLDAKMRGSTRAEILRLHRRLQATIIYVTHDQVEAMTMGDRICVMKDGHIMQVAAPLELYNSPANTFVAGFIGSPAMNFVTGIIQQTNDRPLFVEAGEGGAGFSIPLPIGMKPAALDRPRNIILGIRPEDIHVTAAAGITATVEIREPLGAETYLYLQTSLHTLVARVAPSDLSRPGQSITINFDPAKIHFFDPITGNVCRFDPS